MISKAFLVLKDVVNDYLSTNSRWSDRRCPDLAIESSDDTLRLHALARWGERRGPSRQLTHVCRKDTLKL